MGNKRIVLHFPKELVDKPIVYRLVKDYDLSFNILKAEVNPKEEGILILEINGREENYLKGLEYLKKEGVRIQLLSNDVFMDENKCVSCGVCVPLCPSYALFVEAKSKKVIFDKEKCIACGICIQACPYNAMIIELDKQTN